MTIDSAYLLVFHGSRDPRAQQGMEKLSRRVLLSLETCKSSLREGRSAVTLLSQPLVIETACLELGEVSLAERLYQLGLEATKRGIDNIKVLPLLLATGVHVQIDIPREVALAQSKLGVKMKIESHLGNYEGMLALIEGQYQNIAQEGKIIVAHGSSLSEANREIERLASKLGALAAYAFISPSLETQVETLIGSGIRVITIVPYVLFPGKITDAIASMVEQLQTQYPEINFRVKEPLGQIPALAQIILGAISA
ncbi:sirohydrochlorin chelatase [Gloeocapsa sp. PCC 73106]|uniref:sirohydrochlorin chelatase n=1 Tax=Gloeocapsa sp. PCC 73106 TaxID=102232 RepID=UPI0002AC13BE|nr:sirohydrochlorin chelatase [Gloeocapsa sp. PCC 73106]ELR97368.1 hypothetical protein GLO73106DRAFT_00011770 [Gloeocapsa sp. PCC 73106]